MVCRMNFFLIFQTLNLIYGDCMHVENLHVIVYLGILCTFVNDFICACVCRRYMLLYLIFNINEHCIYVTPSVVLYLEVSRKEPMRNGGQMQKEPNSLTITT